MAESMSDPGSDPGVLAQTVGGLLGATAALPFLGEPAIAQEVQAAVTPTATLLVQRLVVEPFQELRTRNVTAVVGVAARSLNQQVDTLAEQINNDPHTARAFVEAARAAELTDSSEKLKALGEAFAALVTDPAQIDDEVWFMRQLAPIENYHFRVLACWVLPESEWALRGSATGERLATVKC